MLKQTKLLREKYKTYEGACKRRAFENAMAAGEFARGDKARLYQYKVVADQSGMWRVTRCIADTQTKA